METMERLIDVEVTAHGTILEELEIVCTVTGFRLRLLVEHLRVVLHPLLLGKGATYCEIRN